MKKIYQVAYTWMDEIEEERGEKTVIKMKKKREIALVESISCSEAEKIVDTHKNGLLDYKVIGIRELKVNCVYLNDIELDID